MTSTIRRAVVRDRGGERLVEPRGIGHALAVGGGLDPLQAVAVDTAVGTSGARL
jgi:hypothetical protein